MNWQKQVEQLVGQWTDMQRDMWEHWVDTVRAFGQERGQADAVRADYERQLERWEHTVQQAVAAQREWSAQWARSLDAAAAVSPALSRLATEDSTRQLMEHMQSVMQDWVDSQQRFWDTRLISLQGVDGGDAAQRWEQECQRLTVAWREAAEQAQASLATWVELMERLGDTASTPAADEQPVADQPAAERQVVTASRPEASTAHDEAVATTPVQATPAVEKPGDDAAADTLPTTPATRRSAARRKPRSER
jgi:hypothetical protein